MSNIQASSCLLTCTFHATSTVAIVTTAVEAPFCVSTAGILMTVVQASILTFINICMETEMILYSVSDSLYSNNVSVLTSAIQSISIHLVSCVTAAGEASNGVSTNVFTASICSVTFVDIYEQSILRSLVTWMYNRYCKDNAT